MAPSIPTGHGQIEGGSEASLGNSMAWDLSDPFARLDVTDPADVAIGGVGKTFVGPRFVILMLQCLRILTFVLLLVFRGSLIGADLILRSRDHGTLGGLDEYSVGAPE